MAFKPKIRNSIRVEGNGECAFCGYNKFPEILEAAHIIKEADNPDAINKENGYILCPNCHEAFDRKLFTLADYKEFEERRLAKMNPEMRNYFETGMWPSNTP